MKNLLPLLMLIGCATSSPIAQKDKPSFLSCAGMNRILQCMEGSTISSNGQVLCKMEGMDVIISKASCVVNQVK